MAGDELTPGEIGRWLKRLDDGQNELKALIQGLAFVRQDVWAVEKMALEDDIKAGDQALRRDLDRTQDNLRWLARSVIAVLLTVVITAILAGVTR